MAARLSTCFLAYGWSGVNCRHWNVRSSPSHRLLPASCKMRHRNLSSQHKRQVKKLSPKRLPTNAKFQPNSEKDTESATSSADEISNLNHRNVSHDDIGSVVAVEDTNSNKDAESATSADETSSLNRRNVSGDDVGTVVAVEGTSDEDLNRPTILNEIKPSSTDEMSSFNHEPMSSDNDGAVVAVDDTNQKDLNSLTVLNEIKPLATDAGGGEDFSSFQIQDLIGMIKNAEKNVLLLNQARARALEYLEKILNEKQELQGEINILEMRLAETDARIKVAAQEKVHVELLEDELGKLRHGLSTQGGTGTNMQDLHEAVPIPPNNSIDFLNEELSLLRKENMSLKDDLQALKAELSNVRGTDERLVILEKERSSLESALKELELKLRASQEDVSKLFVLKSECKTLWEKVEHLQELLDKSTKKADQAISVLQQNQELRKKVDRLEQSLEDANAYKSSSEKLQQYNELMQQKMELLEERVQRSDEEINSCVQLYQESVKEFQDTLNSLIEETKKRALDEPVDDLPWEFWSRLLLMIDGWHLEKKISSNDAKLLREMVWKKDGRICDTYMACREKNEREVIATFLRQTSPTRAGIYAVHIAVEMAPVAKVGGLGDVVTGLGKALQKRGHLVEIILPKYDCMKYEGIRDLRALDVVVESYFDGSLFKNKIWVGTVEGLPVYFIEPHHPGNFFWRGQFYGEHDDFKRFSFFSRAALEFLLHAGKKPDIIHCHDWQNLLTLVLLTYMAEEEAISSSAAVPQPQALPLQDRVAIVTGGSRGIGRDICLHLASLGAKLVINYHSNSSQACLLADQINGRAGEASSAKPRAIAVQADVSDAAQVKSLFDAAESDFDAQPHILVTSAGITQLTRSALFDTSVEEFDRVFGVNARGNFLCLKEGANRLKRGGGGRIICLTTSLVASLKPGTGTYTASKAAVEAMVKILAKELKGTRITANCVAPGPIATDMLMEVMSNEAAMRKLVEECPQGRIGQPEDVAPMVGFLATDGAEWVNGQVLGVNGGSV